MVFKNMFLFIFKFLEIIFHCICCLINFIKILFIWSLAYGIWHILLWLCLNRIWIISIPFWYWRFISLYIISIIFLRFTRRYFPCSIPGRNYGTGWITIIVLCFQTIFIILIYLCFIPLISYNFFNFGILFCILSIGLIYFNSIYSKWTEIVFFIINFISVIHHI